MPYSVLSVSATGEQRATWQAEAERQAAQIAELQNWIAELEKAKAWLEAMALLGALSNRPSKILERTEK